MNAQSSDRLRTVIAIQQEIVAVALDAEAIAQLVAERTCAVVRADGGVVELLEDERLVARGVTGELSREAGARRRLEGSLAGRCVLEHRTLHTGDAPTDDRVDPDAIERTGARSIVSVPLRDGARVFGALTVYAREPSAFAADDIEAAELIVAIASLQLGHAANYEQAWRDGREDPLTGLLNRRAYDETLAREAARSRRHGRDLALCLFDLDDFKAVNDTDGHLAGDDVLRRFAGVLRQVRGEDYAFRIGGDEFALVLPETDRDGATCVARRLLETGGVAASVGTATYAGEADGPRELHATADAGLYGAKRARQEGL